MTLTSILWVCFVVVFHISHAPYVSGAQASNMPATEGATLSSPAQRAKELDSPPPAPRLDADELARELSNPTTPLASLTNKLEYRRFDGDLPGADAQDSWLLTFQPVLPFEMPHDSRLIWRPALPLFFDQPVFDPQSGSFDTKVGLGDFAFDMVYGRTYESGLLASAGLFSVLPTATDEALGKDQWQLGPDVVLGIIKQWGVIGTLVTHVWDVAGDDDAPTSFSSAQLFYFFSLGGGWQVGGSPLITYDWEVRTADRLTLPIGLAVSKTTKAGNTPLKLAFEVDYSVIRPDTFGQEWLFRLTVTPVIKNPLASWFN